MGYIGNPNFQQSLLRLNASESGTENRGHDLAAAAFYDLEGTLVSTNLIHTLGFYARNEPGLFRSFKKSAATLLSVPLFAVSDQYSRKVFNDLFFKRYKGETEDRMRYFATDLFEKVLKPAVFPGAFELIETAQVYGEPVRGELGNLIELLFGFGSDRRFVRRFHKPSADCSKGSRCELISPPCK